MKRATTKLPADRKLALKTMTIVSLTSHLTSVVGGNDASGEPCHPVVVNKQPAVETGRQP